MQILLPIAGKGTRVRPHTHSRPKPMLSLAGKPVLGHLLDYLMPLNPSSIILIVGDHAEMIEEYVTSHYSVPFHFRQQAEMKGQSHAISMAADVIGEPLLIVFGDTIFDAPLDRVTDGSIDGSIVVKPVTDPSRFGVVELEGDRVTRLVEKPIKAQSNLATIGVYMINNYRGLLRAIDDQMAAGDALKGEYFLAGALQRMFDHGDNFAAVTASNWLDTGTIDAVLDTHRYLVDQNCSHRDAGPTATIIDPCFIDPSVTLERCVVGPYVSIGPGASITDSVIGDAIIGENASVSGLVITRSIIGDVADLSSPPLSYNISDHSSINVMVSPSAAHEGTAR